MKTPRHTRKKEKHGGREGASEMEGRKREREEGEKQGNGEERGRKEKSRGMEKSERGSQASHVSSTGANDQTFF